jgi:hypothetical protein
MPKISYVYRNRIFMKKVFLIITLLLSLCLTKLYSQSGNDTLIYLITCGPGTETYSIYGHSALRIVLAEKKSDLVYNWGVFDFDTPNFAWKFAKGRLDYLLAVEPIQDFLREYVYEKRYVESQKINLTPDETAKLVSLINENLKPENLKYRYDFYYDDCSTRIRDLIEKAVGEKLLYPPATGGKSPTFREMVGKYQEPYPWLKFGIDLLLGSPSDKMTSYRERMFLPIPMQQELSEAVVNRDGKMTPLIQNPEMILDFDLPVIKKTYLMTPAFVFTIVLILVLIFSSLVKSMRLIRWFDISFFAVFSILAGMMIFFNFFTDHHQLRMNLNMLWLNPFIILCLILIMLDKDGFFWFRLLFYILVGFLAIHFVLPQSFSIANLPLLLILIIRSSVRAGFEWNPLSMHLTKL